jgi:hypothetical protein
MIRPIAAAISINSSKRHGIGSTGTPITLSTMSDTKNSAQADCATRITIKT